MGEQPGSLLSGRHSVPLSEGEAERASNTFLALDDKVNVRHEPGARTVFRVVEIEGRECGEIVFGSDIYPGDNIVDPNAAVTLTGAAAHELTHYYRWQDKSALGDGELRHIDEALTSLEAICRYARQLNDTDVRTLVGDAIVRLKMFVHEQRKGDARPVAATPPVESTEIGPH